MWSCGFSFSSQIPVSKCFGRLLCKSISLGKNTRNKSKNKKSNMRSRRREIGGSLPVANVQELASSKDLKNVLARYVRPELEFDVISIDVISIDESLQIPVIDLTRLTDPEFSCDESAKLHSACKDWGFFQFINHGVSEDIIEKMKVDTQEFFNLPLEEKKAYSQLPNTIEGYGQAFVVSEEQKLDWGDMLFLLPLPINERNMRYWPKFPASFRETLDRYSSELQRVTVSLLGFLAKNLGLEPEKLTSLFENGTQGIRMNYYPPSLHADKVLGISPHSDAVGITLLVQVNEVQGLQIRKNGVWVPVEPVQGAFIVNIGDIIEILSNGEYKSIEHRAIVNPNKERLSIAAFHSPNPNTVIGPIGDLVKENGPSYMTLSSDEFYRKLITNKLDGKSLLDHMKLKN